MVLWEPACECPQAQKPRVGRAGDTWATLPGDQMARCVMLFVEFFFSLVVSGPELDKRVVANFMTGQISS